MFADRVGCCILHWHSWFALSLSYKSVMASYDRQCCSGPNHIFIFLCLHFTFTITVLFSLSHLHHWETHFHHWINGVWLKTDCMLQFSSERKHLHYVYTTEQFTSDYRLAFFLYQTEFLRKYIHQNRIRKPSIWWRVYLKFVQDYFQV